MDHLMINTKYLRPNERLPVMEPTGELEVHSNITLRQLIIQRVEHDGCTSGRARAVLLIAECHSTVPLLGGLNIGGNPTPRSDAHTPGLLVTNYPPTPPIINIHPVPTRTQFLPNAPYNAGNHDFVEDFFLRSFLGTPQTMLLVL